jgi:hypothetical protein
MARIALIALASLATAYGLSFDVMEAKVRPVTKVVQLLKDMQKQLEEEGAKDEETYKKLSCWCKENKDEKTKAVEDASARISQMRNRIEELAATSARLKSEISTLDEEVKKNDASLETASALREQQLKEFAENEQELKKNLDAVGKAHATIGGNKSTASLLQTTTLSSEARNALSEVYEKFGKRLSFEDRRKVEAVLKSSPTFLQTSESGPSDMVAGVLQGLKDDFTSNLEQLRTEEARSKQSHEELFAAKRQEIDAGKANLEKKKEELADSDEERAHKKEDIKDTEDSITADTEFLKTLGDKCDHVDSDWEERQKTRADEAGALSKAVEVLSNDEAHDTFSKALSFVQKNDAAGATSTAISNAVALLMEAARRHNDHRLMTLALGMKIDSFTRVKEAIDKMTVALKKEQEDEVKHRDFCIDALNKNQLETEDKSRSKESVISRLSSIEVTLKQAADESSALTAEIAEMQKQLGIASQNREAENKEFQQTIVEQQEAQKLLKQAITVLENYYVKKEAPALIQIRSHQPKDDSNAAPEGLKDYKKSEGGFPVVSLLQQILADAKTSEAEAKHGEQSAQANYEAFVKATTASVETKTKAIAEQNGVKATAEGDKVQANRSKEGLEAELTALGDSNTQLHASCDGVIKNFDATQTARSDELEALQQAKAILSGAK